MTNEQIFSMPEDKYMCKEQIEFFRKLLLEERDKYNKTLINLMEETFDSETLNTAAPDPMDRMMGATQLAKASSESVRINNLLKEISYALDRIKNYEYGYCLISGEEIGLKRLASFPATKFCVEEQEKIEKRNKQYL